MDNDKFLYDKAMAFHVLSQTATDEAYWRGYLTGMRRRMAGGIRVDDLEAEAFRSMLRSEDPIPNALGRGYKDGIAGKVFVAGEG